MTTTTTPGDPAGFFGAGAFATPSPTPGASTSATARRSPEPAAAAAAHRPSAAPTPAPPPAPIPPPVTATADWAADTTAPDTPAASSGSRPRESKTPPSSQQNGTSDGRDSASASLSPTRPAYMQQFTLTTQLILNRMRGGEGGGLSSALASAAASTPKTAIPSPTYEDVRRRLLDGMSTSTMQMPITPATASLAASSSTSSAPGALRGTTKTTPQRPGGTGAIPKANGSGSKARGKTAADGKGAGKKARASTGSVNRGATARAGQKRKRTAKSEGAGVDDSSSLSDLSGISDGEGPRAAAASAAATAAGTASASASASSTPLTTTKSGRQIQKPETYNPAAMELVSGSGHKRRRDAYNHGGSGGHGKHRPAEQALCRLCSRLAFTKANQMVFCDGCNEAWHQNCHEPHIDDSFINDTKKQWHCATCTAKQDRREAAQQAKKAKVAQPAPAEPPKTKVSWAGRTPGQIRAYLSALPHADLVEMVMRCTSLVPHLAIFPSDENGASPRTPLAGINGNAASTPTMATPTPAPSTSAASQALTINDGTWEDPAGILEAWKRPKPGSGPPTVLAARLQALEAGPDAHLEDPDDFEAFSHTLYDSRGHKLEENGIRA